jgi:hypothetical protein
MFGGPIPPDEIGPADAGGLAADADAPCCWCPPNPEAELAGRFIRSCIPCPCGPCGIEGDGCMLPPPPIMFMPAMLFMLAFMPMPPAPAPPMAFWPPIDPAMPLFMLIPPPMAFMPAIEPMLVFIPPMAPFIAPCCMPGCCWCCWAARCFAICWTWFVVRSSASLSSSYIHKKKTILPDSTSSSPETDPSP